MCQAKVVFLLVCISRALLLLILVQLLALQLFVVVVLCPHTHSTHPSIVVRDTQGCKHFGKCSLCQQPRSIMA
jgi:hypothetical protein